MKHEKTFAAITKLKEIEIELHRLKNALELANKMIDAKKPWVGLTSEEVVEIYTNWEGKKQLSWADLIGDVETKLKDKNK